MADNENWGSNNNNNFGKRTFTSIKNKYTQKATKKAVSGMVAGYAKEYERQRRVNAAMAAKDVLASHGIPTNITDRITAFLLQAGNLPKTTSSGGAAGARGGGSAKPTRRRRDRKASKTRRHRR